MSSSTTTTTTTSQTNDPLSQIRRKMKGTLEELENVKSKGKGKKVRQLKEEYNSLYRDYYENFARYTRSNKHYWENHPITKYIEEQEQYLQKNTYNKFKIGADRIRKDLNPNIDFEYYLDKGEVYPTILRFISYNWYEELKVIIDIYPEERIQQWLSHPIDNGKNGEERVYYGTPLEYCLDQGKDKVFELIWNILDIKDSLIEEEKETDAGELLVNDLLECDGSLVKRWFSYHHFSEDEGLLISNYNASRNMSQLLYSEIRVFDMIPTVVNKMLENTLENANVGAKEEFVALTFKELRDFFIFHKKVTGMKFDLKGFADSKDVKKMWQR